MNNKAQFQSIIVVIVTIFIIGVILVFFNRLNNELYGSLDEYFNSSEKFNQTEAHLVVQDIKNIENSVWDYAFLAIFVGFIIQIVLFSFATRINTAFYWLMVIIDIPALIIGVALSGIWQEMATNPEMVESIARFPITNTLLGTYYPIAIVAIMFISAIILFGKRPE